MLFPLPENYELTKENSSALPEATNDEIVPVRTIEAQHVHDGPAFRGVDYLANAQQGIAAGNREYLRDSGVGCGRVDLLVGIAELDLVIAFENSEQRFPADGGVQKPREFSGAQIAGLQRKRLARGVAQALDLNDVGGGRKRESRGRFGSIVEHFREEDLGSGGEAAAGHLFGVAHQFIEVNFWCGDKSSDAAAALDDSFAFERGESVARGHEADLMKLGEVALGGHRVTGSQLAGFDALADPALDSLVCGQAIVVLR